MKSLQILAIGAALIAGGSALASAQPNDHRDGRSENRSVDRGGNRGGNNFNRGDNRGGRNFVGDRDGRRFVSERRFDRDDRRGFVGGSFFVGQTNFFSGYNWYWDGYRWCRRDHGVVVYFGF